MNTNLTNAIHEVLAAAEQTLDYKVQPEDKKFLVETLERFINRGIEKYIQGGIEHDDPGTSGGFLYTVDHHQEITNEIIDLFFYHGAIDYKRRHGRS